MTAPVYVSPTPDDLGLYMNDSAVNSDRAQYLITQAETLCTAVVSPLPVPAIVVVVRVAARAYVTITSARQIQAQQQANPYGVITSGNGMYLSDDDEKDLLQFAGVGGGAFTLDMLPADYVAPCLPWWDQNGFYAGYGGF